MVERGLVVGERRRAQRRPAAWRVVLTGAGGRSAEGRTLNISENGVSIMTDAGFDIHVDDEIMVEFAIPTRVEGRRQKTPMRRVRYSCRAVRIQKTGRVIGLGLEFMEKLGQRPGGWD